MNPFKYSFDNKRYHTLNYHYKTKFNSKICKISLDASFSCPNKDGTISKGGCIYCYNGGSYYTDNKKSLIEQFQETKIKLKNKWPNSKYIGYFQANSNTYAPLKELKEKYELILKQKKVIGLNIGTRPDCISDEVLNYLEELNKRTYLTIELGLQSMHQKTLKLINRGHDLKTFDNMVKKLRKRKINVIVHIINSLPYETKEMMLETVKHLSKLDIQGIKIHMLHILKNTPLAKLYSIKPFPILTKKEYVDIVCDQLEILPAKFVIHRITGDPNPEILIEPKWLIEKFQVLNDIDKELVRRDTYQGFKNSILNKVKQLLDNNIKSKDIVIDATIGNGNDTLYLANLVSKGHVYGFDIQKEAIKNTEKLLNNNNKQNYTLFQESHTKMLNTLKHLTNKVSAIVFNLGYLPKGNKNITTNYKTTINAIKDSLTLLNNKGICLIVIYPGHKTGKKEDIKINKYLQTINNKYKINKYHNTNNKTAPYLISITNI